MPPLFTFTAAAPTSLQPGAAHRATRPGTPAGQRGTGLGQASVDTQVAAILSRTLAEAALAEAQALPPTRHTQDRAGGHGPYRSSCSLQSCQSGTRFCAGWWIVPGACLGTLSWVGLVALLL